MKQILMVLLCIGIQYSIAQKTEIKEHYPWPYIGNAKLLYSWGEYGGKYSEKIFQADVQQDGWYQLKFWATLLTNETLELWHKGSYTGTNFTGNGVGWESFTTNIWLAKGINNISLRNGTYMVPLAENLHLELISNWKTQASTATNNTSFKKQIVHPDGDANNRVLPNPAGNYLHDIETAFNYTTYAWVYLKKNTRYIFRTSSTQYTDPVLHLFHPANMVTMSWMNDNAVNGSIESLLDLTPTLEGYYQLVVRGTKSTPSYYNAQTNILCNNVLLITKARIGGNLFKHSIGSTTDSLNFFTCKLNNPQADTRLLIMNGQNFNANFYNDDYGSYGGDWQWGFSSRINSAWPTGTKPYLTFVSAYSPFTEGVADTYIGNRNSVAWTFFTNWKKNDCIQAGVGYPLNPNPYYYNCIAWSGGLTNAFYWPGSNFSTWTVFGNDLASFDNYYSNSPARYPGAYNYTRTGATRNNAVVDLWATTNGGTGLYYTHGSVQKPGNNHPHGYDWESKPGSVERSFHPRLGPAGEMNANYGSPVNFYIHNGSFARMAHSGKAFSTADEAVAAGLAIFDNPVLSEKAQNRLKEMIHSLNLENKNTFNRLYYAWKGTWASNAVQSNPANYCRNKEYKQLEDWCLQNKNDALFLLCLRYVEGDHLAETPLCKVSLPIYKHLLEEVKTTYKSNLYDREGKFRIRSDYGNGICFIEKILTPVPVPKDAVVFQNVSLSISPNPVKDLFTVQIVLSATARISMNAISAQTGISKIILADQVLAAGTYQYRIQAKDFAGSRGDILSIRININGTLKTSKVLVVE